MNSQVELNLALILFLPWFAILGYLFLRFPARPRLAARRNLDIASCMWKQVLATSVAYGLFLLVLTVALVVRWRLLRNVQP